MNIHWSHLLFSEIEPAMAIVVAHPDDEVIGAAAHLPRWPNAHVIYVTDGAPRESTDARNAGFACWQDYASARAGEAVAALQLAGIERNQLHWLGNPDQEASFRLREIVQQLFEKFLELRPAVILTQPYEGGHPDHDATAFAVHAARQILINECDLIPLIVEMSAYHNSGGAMATDKFLHYDQCETRTQFLSNEQRKFKHLLFDYFKTQRNVLKQFPIGVEPFRPAPIYDFAAPPHEGELYYERFHWKMTGQQWRALASQALLDLEGGRDSLAPFTHLRTPQFACVPS